MLALFWCMPLVQCFKPLKEPECILTLKIKVSDPENDQPQPKDRRSRNWRTKSCVQRYCPELTKDYQKFLCVRKSDALKMLDLGGWWIGWQQTFCLFFLTPENLPRFSSPENLPSFSSPKNLPSFSPPENLQSLSDFVHNFPAQWEGGWVSRVAS